MVIVIICCVSQSQPTIVVMLVVDIEIGFRFARHATAKKNERNQKKNLMHLKCSISNQMHFVRKNRCDLIG